MPGGTRWSGGGKLPVDGASRTVTCPHCSAANYLPDGLWLQLNPTPRVQAFFLVCDEPELAPPASSEMSLFD